ncbi:Ribonuclease VapC2 [Dyadobacter sp. CECT 9275]|uniref:Ribonuclease VapC n=1 Tax=Dyadobacter helix TaxID=2822344 RepID=A0A916JF47_9BACT|nr:type II toxin-antitoxin system VapC family toxin [Dyadobacter sp. CECT 9275]CAG5007228.1 Ribonuclease VapC2 [Dyadobacter sp. CECT 9275]
MKYFLDTNIVAYIINKRPAEVFSKFQSIAWNEISVSSIVVAELWYGVAKSEQEQRNRLALENFLRPLIVIDFDNTAAEVYAMIRVRLENKGMIIGANDLLIAAHALSLGLTLVTNNVKEFERVEDLKIENWIAK